MKTDLFIEISVFFAKTLNSHMHNKSILLGRYLVKLCMSMHPVAQLLLLTNWQLPIDGWMEGGRGMLTISIFTFIFTPFLIPFFQDEQKKTNSRFLLTLFPKSYFYYCTHFLQINLYCDIYKWLSSEF